MTLAMKLKSLKEPAENLDGLRILYYVRPMYLSKQKENWHLL